VVHSDGTFAIYLHQIPSVVLSCNPIKFRPIEDFALGISYTTTTLGLQSTEAMGHWPDLSWRWHLLVSLSGALTIPLHWQA